MNDSIFKLAGSTFLVLWILFGFNFQNTVFAQPQIIKDSLRLTVLKNVQDSLKFDDVVLKRLHTLTERYNQQQQEINSQHFNKPKNKQKLQQSLNKNRRIELSDILPVKDVQPFIKLHQKLTKSARQKFLASKKLSKEENLELGMEIRVYQTQNVFKTIAAKRIELENLLSTTEKNRVKSLAKEFAFFQQSIKEKKEECGKMQSNIKEKRKCQRDMQSIVEQNEPNTTQLKNMITSFKKDKDKRKILDDLNANYHKWAYDLKMLISPYYQIKDTANFPVKINKYIGYGKPLQFLLLKPEEAQNTLNNYKKNDKDESLVNNHNRLNINGKGMIFFELAKEGKVSIQVFDNAGFLVETLINETKMAGAYNLKIKDNIKDGIFLLCMKDAEGYVVKKYVHLN